jgi:hypothetical protein
MPRSRPGECALCGEQADRLLAEDVFPTWARNQLQTELAETPFDGQWPSRVLLKACEDCNHGLGREFEDPAAPILKPLVRGERKILDREEMAIVASWAWLKDIEYILARPHLWTQQEGRTTLSDRSRSYWRGQLADLRAKRRPPRGYVLRLATVGSPADPGSYRRFAPYGWRPAHARLSSLNPVGLLIVESMRTSLENAARFVEGTRHDTRAILVWPAYRRAAEVGAKTVPLNHSHMWRDEHEFNQESGLGGGWQIRVPAGT